MLDIFRQSVDKALRYSVKAVEAAGKSAGDGSDSIAVAAVVYGSDERVFKIVRIHEGVQHGDDTVISGSGRLDFFIFIIIVHGAVEHFVHILFADFAVYDTEDKLAVNAAGIVRLRIDMCHIGNIECLADSIVFSFIVKRRIKRISNSAVVHAAAIAEHVDLRG